MTIFTDKPYYRLHNDLQKMTPPVTMDRDGGRDLPYQCEETYLSAMPQPARKTKASPTTKITRIEKQRKKMHRGGRRSEAEQLSQLNAQLDAQLAT